MLADRLSGSGDKDAPSTGFGRDAAAGCARLRPKSCNGAWASVYKASESIITSYDDGVYTAENVLEIVAIDSTRAYVRVDTFGYNVGRCRFHGVAGIEGDRLIYRGPLRSLVRGGSYVGGQYVPNIVQARCVLAISRDGALVRLSDENNYCQQGICGSRAYLDDQTWPVSGKRMIRYMSRLKRSQEYAAALAEAGLGPPSPVR